MIDRTRFEEEGFVTPNAALTPAEAARFRAALLELYDALDDDLQKHFINLHAVLDWADELGRHPRILDVVAALLGPDLFLWKCKAFLKVPGPGHVAWHQDLPHWNLVPSEAVTAWVALSDSTEDNGCVQVIPGSHRAGSRASTASADPDSLVSAGLQFDISDDEASQAAAMPLRAGEFSIHHGMAVHGSGANRTESPRIGIGFVYAPAHVRQSSAPDRHVVLVRGQARNGGFFPVEPRPHGARAAQLAQAADYFAKLKSGEIPYNVR
jgi:non-heme Fe2+,alpha-ketoglutarate-dependent halogenase